jgi:hypothetical protein
MCLNLLGLKNIYERFVGDFLGGKIMKPLINGIFVYSYGGKE